MNLQDILISPLTYDLLKENGAIDAREGIGRYNGWKKCAEGCGFDPNRRTPAREAYEDGYYSVPASERLTKAN